MASRVQTRPGAADLHEVRMQEHTCPPDVAADVRAEELTFQRLDGFFRAGSAARPQANASASSSLKRSGSGRCKSSGSGSAEQVRSAGRALQRAGCQPRRSGVRRVGRIESPHRQRLRRAGPSARRRNRARTVQRRPAGRPVATARARSSAASFRSWPAWPLTHSKLYLRPASSRSMSLRMSTFSTGLPSALRQPLRFQPGIHLVMELMTYWLSQRMCRSSCGRWAVERNRSSTAISSPWLLVPCGHPPARQQSSFTYQAHPAGPGFPKAEPSAAAVIVTESILPDPADTEVHAPSDGTRRP